MNTRADILAGRDGAAWDELRTRRGPWLQPFWLAQLAGWFAYFVLHYAGASLYNNVAPWWASFASAVAGFVLTGMMRPVLLRVWHRGPATRVAAALGLAVLFAAPFSAVSEQAYWLGEGYGWRLNSLFAYLGSALWCGSILVTWAGVFVGLTYQQEAHARELQAVRAINEAKEARLAVLRERLNPHFLFNTLNGISTLVLEGETERASSMLDQLCLLLRRSIEDMPTQLVTLAEELELAELYLQIQAIRFEDRLRVDWQIDDASRQMLVPSMILQPLLENAVRYGVQPDPGGATVVVSCSVVAGSLRISVSNSLRFTNRKPGHGIGHRNIRERLHALYGDRARFESGREDDGYRATLQLPATETA